VLVQANHGRLRNLRIKGIPVGQILWDQGWWDEILLEEEKKAGQPSLLKDGDGSIIVVLATDAPLLSRQLKRVARRVGLGLGRQGAMGENYSGDIFIAFSTSTPSAVPPTVDTTKPGQDLHRDKKYPMHVPLVIETVQCVDDATIDVLFNAAADAAEEAVLNALAAAETMTGINGYTARKLPLEKVKQILHDHKAI